MHGLRRRGAICKTTSPATLSERAHQVAATQGKTLAYLNALDLRILKNELESRPDQLPHEFDELNNVRSGAPDGGLHNLYMLTPRSRTHLRNSDRVLGVVDPLSYDRQQLYSKYGIEVYEGVSASSTATHSGLKAVRIPHGYYTISPNVRDGNYRICDGFNTNGNTYGAGPGVGNTDDVEVKENVNFLGGPDAGSVGYFAHQTNATWSARAIKVAAPVTFPVDTGDPKQYPLAGSTFYRSGACQWLIREVAPSSYTIVNRWSGRYLVQRNKGIDTNPDSCSNQGFCMVCHDYHFPAYAGDGGSYSGVFFVETIGRPRGYLPSWPPYIDKSALWTPMRRTDFASDSSLSDEEKARSKRAVVWVNAGTGHVLKTYSSVDARYLTVTTSKSEHVEDVPGASMVMQAIHPDHLSSDCVSLDSVPLLVGEARQMALAGFLGSGGLQYGAPPAILAGSGAVGAAAALVRDGDASRADGGAALEAEIFQSAPLLWPPSKPTPSLGVRMANRANPAPGSLQDELAAEFFLKLGRMISELYSIDGQEKSVNWFLSLYEPIIRVDPDSASLSFPKDPRGFDLAERAAVHTSDTRPSLAGLFDEAGFNVLPGAHSSSSMFAIVTGGQQIYSPSIGLGGTVLGAASQALALPVTHTHYMAEDTALKPSATWLLGAVDAGGVLNMTKLTITGAGTYKSEVRKTLTIGGATSAFYENHRALRAAWFHPSAVVDTGGSPAFPVDLKATLGPPPIRHSSCWLPWPPNKDHFLTLSWSSSVIPERVDVTANVEGTFQIAFDWTGEVASSVTDTYDTAQMVAPIAGGNSKSYTSSRPKGTFGGPLQPVTIWSGDILSDHPTFAGVMALHIKFSAPEGLGLAKIAVYAGNHGTDALALSNVITPLYTPLEHTASRSESVVPSLSDSGGVVDGVLESAHRELRRRLGDNPSGGSGDSGGGAGNSQFTCFGGGASDPPPPPAPAPAPAPAPPPPAATPPAPRVPADLGAVPAVTLFTLSNLMEAATAAAAMGLLHLGGSHGSTEVSTDSAPSSAATVGAMNVILFGFSSYLPMLFSAIFNDPVFVGGNTGSGAAGSRPWAQAPQRPVLGPRPVEPPTPGAPPQHPAAPENPLDPIQVAKYKEDLWLFNSKMLTWAEADAKHKKWVKADAEWTAENDALPARMTAYGQAMQAWADQGQRFKGGSQSGGSGSTAGGPTGGAPVPDASTAGLNPPPEGSMWEMLSFAYVICGALGRMYDETAAMVNAAHLVNEHLARTPPTDFTSEEAQAGRDAFRNARGAGLGVQDAAALAGAAAGRVAAGNGASPVIAAYRAHTAALASGASAPTAVAAAGAAAGVAELGDPPSAGAAARTAAAAAGGDGSEQAAAAGAAAGAKSAELGDTYAQIGHQAFQAAAAAGGTPAEAFEAAGAAVGAAMVEEGRRLGTPAEVVAANAGAAAADAVMTEGGTGDAAVAAAGRAAGEAAVALEATRFSESAGGVASRAAREAALAAGGTAAQAKAAAEAAELAQAETPGPFPTNPYAQDYGTGPDRILNNGLLPPFQTGGNPMDSYAQNAARYGPNVDPYRRLAGISLAVQTKSQLLDWMGRNKLMWLRAETFFCCILVNSALASKAAQSSVTNAMVTAAAKQVIQAVMANAPLPFPPDATYDPTGPIDIENQRHFLQRWRPRGPTDPYVAADPATLLNLLPNREQLAPGTPTGHAPLSLWQYIFDLHLNGVAVDPVYALSWGIADMMAYGMWINALEQQVAAGPSSIADFGTFVQERGDAARILRLSLGRYNMTPFLRKAGIPTPIFMGALPSSIMYVIVNSYLSLNMLLYTTGAEFAQQHPQLPAHPPDQPPSWPPVTSPTPANVSSASILVAFLLCLVHGTTGRHPFHMHQLPKPPPS